MSSSLAEIQILGVSNVVYIYPNFESDDCDKSHS